MTSSLKNILLVITAVVVIGISFSAGVFTGIAKEKTIEPPQPLPAGIEDGNTENVDFSIFWDTWNTINKKYVSSNGPSDKEKIYGAISGLVGSLILSFSLQKKRSLFRVKYKEALKELEWKLV